MSSGKRRAFGLIALFAWLLLPAAPAALAQQTSPVDIEQRLTPEQMHATGLDTLSPAQLQLLNRLLREESAQAVNSPVPSSVAPAQHAPAQAAVQESAPSPPVSSPPASSPPVSSPQSSTAPDPAASKPPLAPLFIGLDDQAIKSRIQGSVSGWAPGTEFPLENGQRWKVLKGQVTLPKTLENPPITVIPGIAGRWFLQVDESLPSARVYRIE